MYESIEGSPPEEGDRRRGDDRVFRRRRLAASVAVLAALGLAARAGVVRATCPCHNCCHHGDSYITWGGLYRALARGVWSPLISDAGASQPHPWVGDAQNSGNDYQLGTGTNCVDPLAAPVLGGVDVVAYRTLELGEPAVWGNASLNQSWAGYTWYFSSAANRAAFIRTPRYYVPQFGGFCAFGIAKEPEWTRETLGPPANPDYWKFVGDELYLFEACQAEYQFDLNVSEAVKMGKDRWHSWFGDHFYSHMAMNTLCLNFDGGDDDACGSIRR